MSYLDAGAMFAEENAARRAEAARRHTEDLENEQHVTNLLAGKDAEIEKARAGVRAFWSLLSAVQADGGLSDDRVAELERLESLYDDAIDMDEGDES